MELKLVRSEFQSDRVFGKLYIDGEYFSLTCEDADRGLTKETPLSTIKRTKVAHKTCVPYGRYRIILSYSNKLKRYLPLLLDVPGWRGIRIHKGSGPEWSSGCPLVGFRREGDRLRQYTKAEEELIKRLDAVNHTDSIYITIEKGKA